jgi:hypothetical protein
MKSSLILFILLFLVSCASKRNATILNHEVYPHNESPASLK